MGDIDPGTFSLGSAAPAVDGRLRTWTDDRTGARLWDSDPTVWPAAPPSDVATRTGWLALPTAMQPELPRLAEFARAVAADGIEHVVVLGMGGSSLAPDVFHRTFGPRPGFPSLAVLDSTHPAAVRAVAARIRPDRSLFVVSSKSGTTTEPNDFLRYFWEEVRVRGADPGPHFAAITDPGSPLDTLATAREFRAVFRALPTVGGRYSALTMFGLVPAALLGLDLPAVLAPARAMATACGPGVPPPENPALRLGAAIGELVRAGRDKLTFLAPPPFDALPIWVEQLVAESTGKIGRGIVPIVGEPLAPPDRYGSDRIFVALTDSSQPPPTVWGEALDRAEAAGHPILRLRASGTGSIAAEFFRWELAVAMAGAVIGIDPFDQPDVELAKELARRAMAPAPSGIPPPEPPAIVAADEPTLRSAVRSWLADGGPGDYLAIQAYLAPTGSTGATLDRIRVALLDRLRLATSVGYGPRFLHSTGQLHKGGPNTGRFLQLVDAPAPDLDVPGAGYTFGRLIRAQAVGDYFALRQKQRRVLRVDLGGDVAGGLAGLERAVRA